jgi:hypothetical protein
MTMMMKLKAWVFLRTMKWIVRFLAKRGLRIADGQWADLMASHLET